MKPHECNVCDQLFITKRNLRDHVSSKHSSETLTCEFCNKSFSNESTLKRHTRWVHFQIQKPPPVKCSICDKKFAQKGNLNVHIKSEHLGVRFTCQLCGKKFVEKAVLRRHEDLKMCKKAANSTVLIQSCKNVSPPKSK